MPASENHDQLADRAAPGARPPASRQPRPGARRRGRGRRPAAAPVAAAGQACRGRARARSLRPRPRSRMMAPCSARSHAAGAPRKVSAGPTVASSATPAERAGQRPAAARDRGAADDDRGDHRQLEADAGVGLHVDELHRREQRGEAGERAHHHERAGDHHGRPHAEQPGHLGVRAGGVDGAAGRRPAEHERDAPPTPPRRRGRPASGRCPGRGRTTGSRPAGPAPRRLRWRSAAPSRQATSVASVTTIAGRPRRATSSPLIKPRPAPATIVPSATSGIGRPSRASRPATTPQIANCEPTEMSICRARITSVMPHGDDQQRRGARRRGRAG